MKFIFALLLSFPSFLMAQDCTLKKDKDAFSNKGKLSTGFMSFQNADLSIDATVDEIDFFFIIRFPSDKCYDETSDATVVFEGGKIKNEFPNNGPSNCKGIFHITFKNSSFTAGGLQKLSTKKVLSITFKDSAEKLNVITFNAEQQEMLLKMAACLAKEAKTLK